MATQQFVTGMTLALALNLSSTLSAEEFDDINLTDDAQKTTLHTAELDRFEKRITEIESMGGAFDSALSEELLGFGLALQRSGRHERAVQVFKRGTHIARINEGLFTATQIPFIKAEVVSLGALGDITEADKRYDYLSRVQEQSLNPGPERVKAWNEFAQWQKSLFLANPKEENFHRLAKMLIAYERSLDDLASYEDEYNLIRSSLIGMLQTYFLVTSFDQGDDISPFERRSSFDENQVENNFFEYFRQADKGAPAVIELLVRTESRVHGPMSLEAFHASLQLADWNLWRGHRRSAFEVYKQIDQVIGELEEAERIEELRTRLFGAPVLLPDIDTVRLLPPAVPLEDGNVRLSFTVTDRGTVRRVERLEVAEGMDGAAGRFIRALRKATFRPKIVDGQTVDLEGIEQSYALPQND